ncbi:MAG: ubiquinol-cytochrome c reductase iron-sulfur subunit [Alphaproteobacteria bacterium]
MADTADESAATGETRRDFLYLATAAVGAAGAAAATWPFIHSMNPAADIRALAVTEVDLSPVAVGQSITVKWQGRPVFIRRRTAAEIAAAQADDAADLPDPEPDAKRVKRPEWLIVVGICTHLGCVPLGQRTTEPRGDFGGWFCPCHGSHYDTSGRIRKGPAPRNLDLPGEVIGEDLHGYAFLDDTTVRIG